MVNLIEGKIKARRKLSISRVLGVMKVLVATHNVYYVKFDTVKEPYHCQP